MTYPKVGGIFSLCPGSSSRDLDLTKNVFGGTSFGLTLPHHLDAALNLCFLLGIQSVIGRIVQTQDQVVSKARPLTRRKCQSFITDFVHRLAHRGTIPETRNQVNLQAAGVDDYDLEHLDCRNCIALAHQAC